MCVTVRRDTVEATPYHQAGVWAAPFVTANNAYQAQDHLMHSNQICL